MPHFGPLDFGGPDETRFAVWERMKAAMAEEARKQDEAANAQAAADWAEEQAQLNAQQLDYRTGCPACYVGMSEPDLGEIVEVDVALNTTQPLLCSHHWRAADALDCFNAMDLAQFLANLRRYVTRTR